MSVTLDVNDERLPRLLRELERAGEKPHPRADRTYTRKELDTLEWLNLRIATAGLSGGANFDQPYDHSKACKECGAGAKPIPPIIADLPRMGKKKIDATANDGLLIITQELGAAIETAGLTGFELLPVRRRSQTEPDPNYYWLRITSEWPTMAPDSVLAIENLCTECERAGHFDTYGEVTEYRYASVPQSANDFNQTWEYFGVWKWGRVGGARGFVVSQRVRQCFLAMKVTHVRYEPVFFSNERAEAS